MGLSRCFHSRLDAESGVGWGLLGWSAREGRDGACYGMVCYPTLAQDILAGSRWPALRPGLRLAHWDWAGPCPDHCASSRSRHSTTWPRRVFPSVGKTESRLMLLFVGPGTRRVPEAQRTGNALESSLSRGRGIGQENKFVNRGAAHAGTRECERGRARTIDPGRTHPSSIIFSSF